MAVQKDDAVNIDATPAVAKPMTNASSPGMFGKIKRYLREVMAELKKTNWPSRDELTKSTVVIVLTIVVVAVFLWACDSVVAKIMASKFVNIVPSTTGN
jgi:preprotein translocase subunit SecE